jgi:WD40 repeat protein
MHSHRRGYRRLVILLGLFCLMLSNIIQTTQAGTLRVSIGWSASGQYIAIGYDYDRLKIFRASTGEMVLDDIIDDGRRSIISFEWSPTEDKLGVITGNALWYSSKIWMITPANGNIVQLEDESIARIKSTIAWHPNGQTFAIFVDLDTERSLTSEVRVYDATSGNEVKRKLVMSNIIFLTWQPGGQLLAAGTIDGRIIILNGESLEIEADWQAYNGSVISMAWNPDGSELVAIGPGEEYVHTTVYGWRDGKEANRRIIRQAENTIYNLRWNHNGTQLVFSASPIIVLNAQTSEVMQTIDGVEDGIAAWHPSLNKLAYAPVGDGYAIADITPVVVPTATHTATFTPTNTPTATFTPTPKGQRMRKNKGRIEGRKENKVRQRNRSWR